MPSSKSHMKKHSQNNKDSRSIILLSTILLYSCSNDFDITCGYFNDLLNAPNLEEMTSNQRFSFINKKIKNFDENSSARVLWESTAASPNERYDIYKFAIEDTIGKEWSCPSNATTVFWSTKPDTLIC